MVLRNSDSNASLSSTSSRRSRASRKSLKASSSSSSLSHSASGATLDMDALRRQFDEFDKDGSGYLDRKECSAALCKLGSKLSFADLDTDNDDKISFDEFTVVSNLMGTHKYPIFKHANKAMASGGGVIGGAQAFAGHAHLNEAFMSQASNAWRKVGASQPHTVHNSQRIRCTEGPADIAVRAHGARATQVGVEARARGDFNAASVARAFRKLDLDKSGVLDTGEVRRAMKTLAPQLTEYELTIMLACADADADGGITEDEFTKLMLYDADKDVGSKPWEKYGQRDMHTSAVAERSHQIRY